MKANFDLKTIFKKIKYNYKNFFIFILFFYFFIFGVQKLFCEDDYYYTTNNPCDPSDSWVLYRNNYEDTIIVTNPYGD